MPNEPEQLEQWAVDLVHRAQCMSPYTHEAARLLQSRCIPIEQHEAFKAKVSEAMKVLQGYARDMSGLRDVVSGVRFSDFIIPEPVDPVRAKLLDNKLFKPSDLDEFLVALAKHGLTITEIDSHD